MEEMMPQQEATTTQPAILVWWGNTRFTGKENYNLTQDGQLMQNAIGSLKERVISTLQADTAEITLKALKDKFGEVENKFKELAAEWDATADKLKLAGKVERMKDYLQHTAAVGAIQSFVTSLSDYEDAIKALVEENHNLKAALAKEAEAFATSNTWKETTQAFKDLADKWKQIGYVDKQRNDDLWAKIETAKNTFYERKRQNHEDVNKELLQNLDLKMEMVEKAEKLAASSDWKETTEAFHNLMDEWKKTGRTIHDKNEELWHRFITAKNTFFDKKKAHFDNIQQEQETNLLAKIALAEKAEALKDSTEWTPTAQAFTALMDEWKKIGRVPQDKADEVWNRFIGAKEHFFNAKKHHTETLKVTLQDNYAQKLALVKRAEQLQHSNQWREATDEMVELMDEWKKIGPVPREHNEPIWEQFSKARKKFFERKDANREQRKQIAEKNKAQRIERAHSFVKQLEEEIKDEKERLEDFKNSIQNITPGRKAEELRQHLEKLIAQTESKIQHKLTKLEDAKKQIAQDPEALANDINNEVEEA
ncbi:hypothetical protein CAP35_02970 [Chitinophagaceae bacterium IBVUCB1]|nr:hypothetical protein CAP35_02970 [Chitinophagaceae bacterium IBVUCB1]